MPHLRQRVFQRISPAEGPLKQARKPIAYAASLVIAGTAPSGPKMTSPAMPAILLPVLVMSPLAAPQSQDRPQGGEAERQPDRADQSVPQFHWRAKPGEIRWPPVRREFVPLTRLRSAAQNPSSIHRVSHDVSYEATQLSQPKRLPENSGRGQQEKPPEWRASTPYERTSFGSHPTELT
jgi:hypothetical protein